MYEITYRSLLIDYYFIKLFLSKSNLKSYCGTNQYNHKNKNLHTLIYAFNGPSKYSKSKNSKSKNSKIISQKYIKKIHSYLNLCISHIHTA